MGATEPLPALALGIDGCLQLIAPRGQVGERAGQFAEGLLGGGEHGLGVGDAAVGVAA